MFERGKLIPNVQVKDEGGDTHELWNFRQKSHVALVWDRHAGAAGAMQLAALAKAKSKAWDWLNVKVVIATEAPDNLPSGAYAIDRFGIFLNVFPINGNVWNDLENEFLYYEAKHC